MWQLNIVIWVVNSSSLFHLLNKNDSLGVLPTNFGKSIIYQIAPFVARDLADKGYSILPSNPVIIVVTPINALIDDQIRRCADMNIKAFKLCAESKSLFENGDVDLIYSSPECLLDNSYREILLSDVYRSHVIGVVVDEAHLVVKW